jgi:DNA-binding CsgD family transcriptional regulator
MVEQGWVGVGSDGWGEGVRPVRAVGRPKTPQNGGEIGAYGGQIQRAGRLPPPLPPGGIERAMTATLDKLNRGVVLIREDGVVAFANRAAQAMAARAEGIAVSGGRLELRPRAMQERFEGYLERHGDTDGGASLVLQVTGPRQRGGYRVLVSPLEAAEGAASLCVFIYEPEAGRRALPVKVLRQLYGLTPGEARLTNELFVGKSLADAATATGVTVNTARSRLKRIFGKCSVGSQAELLQLLSLGPRTL